MSALEKFVNKHRVRFDRILKGTKYENSVEFEFLPGHTALILSLPAYVNELESTNLSKKSTVRKRRFSKTEDHPENISVGGISADVDKNEAERSEIRQQLINKINNFATDKFAVVLAQEHIIDFHYKENSGFKCKVQCPLCERKVPCNFITHWKWGNIKTHLATHFTQEEYVVIESENNQHSVISAPNVKISKLANMNEISEMLDK